MIHHIFPKGHFAFLMKVNNGGFPQRSIVAALDHLNVSREKQKIILKKEQEMAVKELLDGKDVMAILPTGFGKSLIFTIFAIAKGQISRSEKTCVLVISPLKSIIDDQIAEMASLNYRALVSRQYGFHFERSATIRVLHSRKGPREIISR